MEPGDIPLFAMLKGRLGYLSDRQRVIAENVANANTPGYQARDLKPFSFQAHVQAATGSAAASGVTAPGMMAVTQPGHMQPKSAGPLGRDLQGRQEPGLRGHPRQQWRGS